MMEAPLVHQSPVPVLLLPNFDEAAVAAGGREQCPRCSSRDTKFCYYNNYNTAQPRHFCRACRRYWTLGGSLRNVPIGGSSRKRPRPPRPTRAAVAAAAAAAIGTATTSGGASGCAPFFAASSSSQSSQQQQQPAASAPSHHEAAPNVVGAGGGWPLLESLLGLGSRAPLLEGRLGFDLGLGQPASDAVDDFCAAAPVPPLLWPARILEGSRDRAAVVFDTWKAGGTYFPAALWQELAAAPPVELAAGGLQRHGAPYLM
ncbi:hypothetical protein GUJ93_ZPchr0009g1824 [Zizania palustris]|uniref:Dof zinc finger protein n=1 Tax=Zizania palustris TaxID=103762 RepID=A0A8J5RZQ9_ZIZPA|nr:hypothetical protein GUJ93_ZPchr0009g1824 [Zizania palustris]